MNTPRQVSGPVLLLCALVGALLGAGGFTFREGEGLAYLGNESKTCANCHIMRDQYDGWQKASHHARATCNDCHVPHDNIVTHYLFKGVDGMKHVAYFVTHNEPQVIRAETMSAQVIMDNCIRCHTQLNSEFVKTGRINYMMAKRGDGMACWDCHRQVAHGGVNSLSSTPNGESQVPLPSSPVPEWIQRMVNR